MKGYHSRKVNSVVQFVAKVFGSLIVIALGLIPTWFGLAIWYFSGASGFWQNAAVIIAVIFFGGTIQIITLIVSALIILDFVLPQCDNIVVVKTRDFSSL